jgi:outer membrane protein OmpA-like peptidoglycan-associated protein
MEEVRHGVRDWFKQGHNDAVAARKQRIANLIGKLFVPCLAGAAIFFIIKTKIGKHIGVEEETPAKLADVNANAAKLSAEAMNSGTWTGGSGEKLYQEPSAGSNTEPPAAEPPKVEVSEPPKVVETAAKRVAEPQAHQDAPAHGEVVQHVAEPPAAVESGSQREPEEAPPTESVILPVSFSSAGSVAQVADGQAFSRLVASFRNCAGRIKLVGHSDKMGTEEVNHALGLKRADSVKVAFEKAGIVSAKIEIESKGSLEPVAPNETSEGRAANRRVSAACVN